MFIRNSVKLNLLIILIIFSINSIAQTKDTIEIQRNKQGKITFGLLKPSLKNKIKDGGFFLRILVGTTWSSKLFIKG